MNSISIIALVFVCVADLFHVSSYPYYNSINNFEKPNAYKFYLKENGSLIFQLELRANLILSRNQTSCEFANETHSSESFPAPNLALKNNYLKTHTIPLDNRSYTVTKLIGSQQILLSIAVEDPPPPPPSYSAAPSKSSTVTVQWLFNLHPHLRKYTDAAAALLAGTGNAQEEVHWSSTGTKRTRPEHDGKKVKRDNAGQIRYALSAIRIESVCSRTTKQNANYEAAAATVAVSHPNLETYLGSCYKCNELMRVQFEASGGVSMLLNLHQIYFEARFLNYSQSVSPSFFSFLLYASPYSLRQDEWSASITWCPAEPDLNSTVPLYILIGVLSFFVLLFMGYAMVKKYHKQALKDDYFNIIVLPWERSKLVGHEIEN